MRCATTPARSFLDVGRHSTTWCETKADWADAAFKLFARDGFVVIEDLLSPLEQAEVLCACEREAAKIVGPERRGNRGPGRYSFGAASSTGGMLHVPEFSRHLLESAGSKLRPLLDLVFYGGWHRGFVCIGGGGDFVLDGVTTYQQLHSDMQVRKDEDVLRPPPLISVNFAAQDLDDFNGATRFVPGTQLSRGEVPYREPSDWLNSRLNPLRAGSAIVRDVRVLHGGTPNISQAVRFLPSIEYASADFRATGRKDCFPPPRGLPRKLYDELQPEVQELCWDIVAYEAELKTTYIPEAPRSVVVSRRGRAVLGKRSSA